MHLRLLTALCNDTLEGANMRAELAGRVDRISALQSERHQMQLEVHCASHAVGNCCAGAPRGLVLFVLLCWCSFRHIALLFCLCCCAHGAAYRTDSTTLVSIALSAFSGQHCLVSIHTVVSERQTYRQQVDLVCSLSRQSSC